MWSSSFTKLSQVPKRLILIPLVPRQAIPKASLPYFFIYISQLILLLVKQICIGFSIRRTTKKQILPLVHLTFQTAPIRWAAPASMAPLVAQTVKNLPATQKAWVPSLCQEDPLGEGVATHSSIFAWRIPWTEESVRLQSVGLHRVRHNRSNLARMHASLST